MNELKERFLTKFEETDGCWEWQGTIDAYGYGTLHGSRGNGERKTHKAHRLAWVFSGRTIPDFMLVCHHCDNRRCVNPGHLFVGTAKDNTQDMLRKGRRPSPRKLTEEQASEIRLRLATGESQATIACSFPVGQSTISRVKREVGYGRIAG